MVYEISESISDALAAVDRLEDKVTKTLPDRVLCTARALLAKVDEVHADEGYQRVWRVQQLYASPYRGPTYEAELEALREALSALDAKREENLSVGGDTVTIGAVPDRSGRVKLSE